MREIRLHAFIEDVQNARCSDEEIKCLTEFFYSVLLRPTTIRAQKIQFKIAEVPDQNFALISSFSMSLERRSIGGHDQWWGTFESGEKNLKIIGAIEEG